MGVIPCMLWESRQQNLLQLKIKPHLLSLFGKKTSYDNVYGGKNKIQKFNFSGTKHF